MTGNASGKYEFPAGLDPDDCEFVDDMNEGEEVEEDAAVLDNIMKGYGEVIDGGITKIPSVSDGGDDDSANKIMSAREQSKEVIKASLGEDIYNEVLELILKYRTDPSTDGEDEDNMYNEIKEVV